MRLKNTLLIRNLPKELNLLQREEFLKIVGAVAVCVMPDDGKMKFTAFATFKDEEDAKNALLILHQKEILGQCLIVEYAKEKHQKLVPHVSDYHDNLQSDLKETSSNSSERNVLKRDLENFSKALHGIAPALGLDYLSSPLLKYKYPPPTPTIIQNICHALASVPKFYTQVLHLMNKMNLPAPFGPVTPAPPLASDLNVNIHSLNPITQDVDIVNSENMDVTSSEEESEYESESEAIEKPTANQLLPAKRPSKNVKKKLKIPKIAMVPAPPVGPSKPRTEPSEVFESQPLSQKKINVKKIDHITPADSAVTNPETLGGFGAFEAPKLTEDEDAKKESGNEIWDDSQFISLEELREKRISSREMKTTSVFKKYSPGEPTFRLYIKNLARQVDEKDLRYIFGRFIDRNSENDRNMFDVRLMKEGRMKGQAFVTLANEKQAIRAIKETNGFILHTKPMVVQFARSAKPKDDDKKEQKS